MRGHKKSLESELEEARREHIMGYSTMLVPKGFGIMGAVAGIAGLIYSVVTHDLELGITSSGLLGLGAFMYNMPKLKCVQDLVDDAIHTEVEREYWERTER